MLYTHSRANVTYEDFFSDQQRQIFHLWLKGIKIALDSCPMPFQWLISLHVGQPCQLVSWAGWPDGRGYVGHQRAQGGAGHKGHRLCAREVRGIYLRFISIWCSIGAASVAQPFLLFSIFMQLVRNIYCALWERVLYVSI